MSLVDRTRYFRELSGAPTPSDVQVPNTISRDLLVEERSFIGIAAQAGKPLLDAEVNFLQQIPEALYRQRDRYANPSGWMKPPGHSDRFTDYVTLTAPVALGTNVPPYIHADGTLVNSFVLPKLDCMVAGFPVTVEYVNTAAPGYNLVGLDTPTVYDGTPLTAKRADFVFLEVWKVLVVPSTAASAYLTVVNNGALVNGDEITLDGAPLTLAAVPGVDEFAVGATATDTATAIADAINDPGNSYAGTFVAIAIGSSVYLYAATPGTSGNALTLSVTVATPGAITVSGGLLSGGLDQNNKPSQDTIYRHGNTQSPSATWLADNMVDTTIGRHTAARIQLQYRIRSVSGVDTKTNPDGFSARSGMTPIINAQGPRSSPQSGYPFVPADKTTTWGSSSAVAYGETDSGLWVAGDGSVGAAIELGALDGYVYAIPLCVVYRHNDVSDATAAVQGWDPVNNANGAPVYDHAGYTGVLGVIPAGASDRPDGSFADVISSDRILDKRHFVSNVSFDTLPQIQALLDGSLKTWAVDISDIQDMGTSGDMSHTFMVCNEIGRTVAESGSSPESGDTGRGVIVRNFDHVARRFGTNSVVERFVVGFYPGDRPTALAQGGPVSPGLENPGKYVFKAESAPSMPYDSDAWYEDDVLHLDLTVLDATTLGWLFAGKTGGGDSAPAHPDSSIANFMPPNTVITDILTAYHDDGHYTTGVNQDVQFKKITGLGTQYVQLTLDANRSVVNGGDPGNADYAMVGSGGSFDGSPRRIFVEFEVTYPVGSGLTHYPDVTLTPDVAVFDGSAEAGPGPMVATTTAQRPADMESLLPPAFRSGFKEVKVEYAANDADTLMGGFGGDPIGSTNVETLVSANRNTLVFPRRVCNDGTFANTVTVEDAVVASAVTVDFANSHFGSSSREIALGNLLSGNGQTLCQVEYFAQDPVPNYGVAGFQVGVYYRSRAPQTAGVKAGAFTTTSGGGAVPTVIQVQPLSSSSLWTIQTGPGSSEVSFPYPTASNQIPSNDGLGGVLRDWILSSTAQIALSDFDVNSGMLALHPHTQMDMQTVMQFGGLGGGEVPLKDPEFRAYYPYIPPSAYRPVILAQNLAGGVTHKVVFPFLARIAEEDAGASGGLLYRKGEVVLVVLSRWALLDNGNTIVFDGSLPASAAIYKTRNLLLTSEVA